MPLFVIEADKKGNCKKWCGAIDKCYPPKPHIALTIKLGARKVIQKKIHPEKAEPVILMFRQLADSMEDLCVIHRARQHCLSEEHELLKDLAKRKSNKVMREHVTSQRKRK